MEHSDLTLPVDGGWLNLRVGAIIQKNGNVLMVSNDAAGYCYSVGGRIRFGETAEEAVIREVEEETGVRMKIDRLGFLQENFFFGDTGDKIGALIYEVSYYFYMKTPEGFDPVCESVSSDVQCEYLKWVSPDGDIPYYPAFFKMELKKPCETVKHIVTDERIGLRRGTVRLGDHQQLWETEAERTIHELKEIFGNAALDVQHVGSTAIPAIKAKPIIDLAVAVQRFDDAVKLIPEMERHGYYYRPEAEPMAQMLFAKGSYYDGTGDIQTHFIHVVQAASRDWIDYINFRDYMNAHPDDAMAYEALKLRLATENPNDNGRRKYLAGKRDFILDALRKAAEWRLQ